MAMKDHQQRNILIVDDEVNIRRVLRMYLQKEGFSVEEAEDGVDAWRKMEQTEYDLIILDLMLPKIGGIELCTMLRQKRLTPVIILSAKGEESDRLRGFEVGADDYVVKPFSPKEVVYRIKTILQRTSVGACQILPAKEAEHPILLPHLTIEPRAHRVTVGERVVELARKEYELLYFFATHPNTTFSRKDLVKRVWSDASIQDQRTVDTHIRKIRKKLSAISPEAANMITTKWGQGYQLNMEKE